MNKNIKPLPAVKKLNEALLQDNYEKLVPIDGSLVLSNPKATVMEIQNDEFRTNGVNDEDENDIKNVRNYNSEDLNSFLTIVIYDREDTNMGGVPMIDGEDVAYLDRVEIDMFKLALRGGGYTPSEINMILSFLPFCMEEDMYVSMRHRNYIVEIDKTLLFENMKPQTGNKKLYENLINRVSKAVKNTLNEALYDSTRFEQMLEYFEDHTPREVLGWLWDYLTDDEIDTMYNYMLKNEMIDDYVPDEDDDDPEADDPETYGDSYAYRR